MLRPLIIQTIDFNNNNIEVLQRIAGGCHSRDAKWCVRVSMCVCYVAFFLLSERDLRLGIEFLPLIDRALPSRRPFYFRFLSVFSLSPFSSVFSTRLEISRVIEKGPPPTPPPFLFVVLLSLSLLLPTSSHQFPLSTVTTVY